MACNYNFESNRPLTHESAKAMVDAQRAASRKLEAGSKAALKACGNDRYKAFEMLLANGGPFTPEVAVEAHRVAA